MVELPKEVYDNVFDDEIKRGYVLRTLFLCHDGTEKPHYYITISQSSESDPLIFVISTSRIDFYNKHPQFNNDIIKIPSGEVGFFPADTVIDCRKIFKLTREKLKRNFKEDTLRFCGELPAEMLGAVDKIIKKSRFISRKDKKLILGQNFDTDG